MLQRSAVYPEALQPFICTASQSVREYTTSFHLRFGYSLRSDNDAVTSALMQLTFNDRGKSEAEFLTEFLVRCPRCDKCAFVRSNGVPWTVTQARLTCSACGHSDSWVPGRPKGVAIGAAKRRCPRCARWLEKRFRGSPSPREAHLHCVACGMVVREPVSWMRLPGALTRDPFFDCALWLVGDVKGDVFWAYNRAHLGFIRDYVAATLRIRQPYKNSSMASRLPAFLLAKKNRGAVLKEIDRLARDVEK